MWMDYTDECKDCPKGFCNCCNDPPMARTLKLPDQPDAGSSAIYRLKKSILLILYLSDLIEPKQGLEKYLKSLNIVIFSRL